jgi:hypothetical protein
MKTPSSSIALALTAAALLSATSAMAREYPIEKSFAVTPGGVLKIDSNVASAEITTGDTKNVEVRLERNRNDRYQRENDALLEQLQLEMVEANNTVRLVARVPDDRKREMHSIPLAFRIIIPRKFNVDARTLGSSSLADLDGVAKISTAGGGLKIGNVTGSVTARSAGGGITVGDIGADLNATTAGGSLKIGKVAGSVTAHAAGGSVTIAEAEELREATATGGSVTALVTKPPRADAEITATGGSIDLRLADSSAARIDAACIGGRIRSDFAIGTAGESDSSRLKGEIGRGGPALALRATGGSINLRKATR